MKKTSGMMLGALMAAVISSGMALGIEDTAKAGEKNAKAVEKASACCPSEVAIPKPQKVQIPGVTLINPENSDEAVLLIQMVVPGKDGQSVPRMVGLPLKMDVNGKKLVNEYGVKSAKSENSASAEKTRKEAMEKFVMVSGTVNFDSGSPVLTVEKYESAKGLIAQAKQSQKTPEKTTAAQPADKVVN